jgi:hypothetical protein
VNVRAFLLEELNQRKKKQKVRMGKRIVEEEIFFSPLFVALICNDKKARGVFVKQMIA